MIALARACLVSSVLVMEVACGPVVAPDETTAAVGSTGSLTSTSSSSGHAEAGTTEAGTTEAGTTEAGTTAAATTSAASSGEVCGASGRVDDCCCFELDGSLVDVICSSVPVCEQVVRVTCDGGTIGQFCPLGGAQVSNPTDLDCVLEALAGSSIGHFDVRESPDGGFSGRDYTIYLTGTQEAFMLTNVFSDFSGTYDEAPRLMLESPEYFVACQQEALAIDRYRCMRTGLAQVVEECLPLPP